VLSPERLAELQEMVRTGDTPVITREETRELVMGAEAEAPGRCGEPLSGYPPCHLPEGHEEVHAHQDGQCLVALQHVRTTYEASDPNKGVYYERCVLFAGHEGKHEIRTTHTTVRRFR